MEREIFEGVIVHAHADVEIDVAAAFRRLALRDEMGSQVLRAGRGIEQLDQELSGDGIAVLDPARVGREEVHGFPREIGRGGQIGKTFARRRGINSKTRIDDIGEEPIAVEGAPIDVRVHVSEAARGAVNEKQVFIVQRTVPVAPKQDGIPGIREGTEGKRRVARDDARADPPKKEFAKGVVIPEARTHWVRVPEGRGKAVWAFWVKKVGQAEEMADAMDERTRIELAPIAQAKGKRAPKDGRGIAQGHRGKHPGEIERPIFFLSEWGIVNEIGWNKGTPFAIRRGELGAWALRISRVVPGNRGFVKILEDRRLLFRGSDGIEFRDGIRGTEIGGGNGAAQVEAMIGRDVVIGRDAWIIPFLDFPEERLGQGKRTLGIPGRIGEIHRDDKKFLLPDGRQTKAGLARQKIRVDRGDVFPHVDEALQRRRRREAFPGNEVKAFAQGREFIRDEADPMHASA